MGPKLRHPVVPVSQLTSEYCVGLAWVMQYYYRGVPSWSWYYPGHYGPLLSDMVGFAETLPIAAASHRMEAWFV